VGVGSTWPQCRLVGRCWRGHRLSSVDGLVRLSQRSLRYLASVKEARAEEPVGRQTGSGWPADRLTGRQAGSGSKIERLHMQACVFARGRRGYAWISLEPNC
jgi:hypothetical protein